MAWFDDTAKVVTFFANIALNIVPPIFGTNILGFLNPAIVEDVWGLTLSNYTLRLSKSVI